MRAVKIFSNGAFKEASIPQMEGFDVNNAFNSMLKDYAYKLKGVSQKKEEILIKIPMTFENEFESLYSIDDLFIGGVTIIGIYKGKIKISKLKNSFEFFQELGQEPAEIIDPEIHESETVEKEDKTSGCDNLDQLNYHYLDLLAIVQKIDLAEEPHEKKTGGLNG